MPCCSWAHYVHEAGEDRDWLTTIGYASPHPHRHSVLPPQQMFSFGNWSETQTPTHFVLTCTSLFGSTSPDLIIFPSCSLQTLINQSRDLWLPGIYTYSYLRLLPAPDWADDCLSSSPSTWTVLLHIWCLLTGSITPLYWLYWKRCPLWGYSSEAVSEACISLFISRKEQNIPLLCKEYFELQAIEEKQRQEKLSALSLFA